VGRGVGVLVACSGLLACAAMWGGVASADIARKQTYAPLRPLPRSALARPQLTDSPALAPATRRAAVTASTRVAQQARGRPKAHLAVSPANMTYLGGRVLLKWSSSNAKHCTIASNHPFWRGPNPARVRCRGSFGGTLGAVAVAFGWKFTFTAKSATGKAVAHGTFVIHAPPFGISSNWAGYAINRGTPITEASGQFTIPTLNCSVTRNASETTWVGIGGDGTGTGDLLQTGVDSTCSGGTQIENPSWWEEFPEYPSINFQGMSISPGDQIKASVYEAGDGSWVTRVDDLTTGISGVMNTGNAWGTVLDSNPTAWLQQEGDASTVSYNGGSSAEWIVEDYGLSDGSQVPFADFGTVALNNLTTSLSSWNLNTGDALGIGDKYGDLLAAPSAPSGGGFSVTYTG
jgi:Peptidase A4 family